MAATESTSETGRRRVGHLFAGVTRSTSREITNILVEHVHAAIAAVEVIHGVDPSAAANDGAESDMAAIEHRGDHLRGELISRLHKTMMTPLDPEDLNRLSRSIDDVLDNLRDFYRELSMYGVGSSSSYRRLTDLAAAALGDLVQAVKAIPESPTAVMDHTLPAKKTCNSIRREYQASMAELFAAPLTMEVIKHRELLRRLDIVGLRLNEAIDVLSDAAVKRGA